MLSARNLLINMPIKEEEITRKKYTKILGEYNSL